MSTKITLATVALLAAASLASTAQTVSAQTVPYQYGYGWASPSLRVPAPSGGMQVGSVLVHRSCQRTPYGLDCGGGFWRPPSHSGQVGGVSVRRNCVRIPAGLRCF